MIKTLISRSWCGLKLTKPSELSPSPAAKTRKSCTCSHSRTASLASSQTRSPWFVIHGTAASFKLRPTWSRQASGTIWLCLVRPTMSHSFSSRTRATRSWARTLCKTSASAKTPTMAGRRASVTAMQTLDSSVVSAKFWCYRKPLLEMKPVVAKTWSWHMTAQSKPTLDSKICRTSLKRTSSLTGPGWISRISPLDAMCT